jgi:hypothetical protein
MYIHPTNTKNTLFVVLSIAVATYYNFYFGKTKVIFHTLAMPYYFMVATIL